jgi:hypothetical protein
MSDQMPDWLPCIVSVSGEWEQVLARLYGIFNHDFVQTGCRFEGGPVWWDRRKLDGSSYEEGFWHLITKVNHKQNERLLNPRRAERLPWCKPTIVNSSAPEVKAWSYKEAKGKIRMYLWLENWDYVIVLEKRQLRVGRNIAFLITAFYVEGESTRKSLRRKYQSRIR